MFALLRLLFTLLWLSVVITGCTLSPNKNNSQPVDKLNIDARTKLLTELSDWKINGKIGFITPKERKSASIYWKKSPLHQKLNLTTYLGINVLELSSDNNIHTIEMDGNKYTGTNLDELITSLTELTLPTEALNFWMKALPYLHSDKVMFGSNNLPKTLTSTYSERTWDISYSSYKYVQVKNINVMLPYKIKVKSSDLTINIAIKNWTI